jgi:cob(I)alamin adenosyltransferase
MAYRLTKIYTKKGDRGTTALGDGTRVDKDHPRVEAYGDIDELNSLIGTLAAQDIPEEVKKQLIQIQHDLFDIGGELCIPGNKIVSEVRIKDLEEYLDKLNAELAPLDEFILPGGTEAASVCHQARAVCRRAERKVITLSHSETIGEIVVPYLNRLSDLLFVIARFLNKSSNEGDIYWDRSRS